MPQITKLVKMQATEINGNISLDLDTALEMSADSIRTLYGMLAEQTGKSEFGTAAAASYQFAASGFADSIYDVAFAFFESLSLGYSFSRCAGGEFTLTSDIKDGETYTITHDLGVIPDIVLLFTPDIEPSSSWAGTNNAVVNLAANWSLTNPVQFGTRVRSGTDPKDIASGGFYKSSATSSTVQFKSISTTATGIALAAGCRYLWVAAKVKPASGS